MSLRLPAARESTDLLTIVRRVAVTHATRRTLMTAALAAPALLLAACGGDANEGSGPMAEHQRPDDRILGDPDAPVLVVEYASITCGHCATFHDQVLPQFKEKYVDTGLVKFAFRELPTPPIPVAMAGFLVARCAPGDEYYDVIDTLFERQGQVIQNPREELLNVARAAGLSESQFESCISDQERIEAINAVVEEASDRYNVTSTPTFLIDGETYSGVRALSFFDETLAPLLGDRAPAAEPADQAGGEGGEG